MCCPAEHSLLVAVSVFLRLVVSIPTLLFSYAAVTLSLRVFDVLMVSTLTRTMVTTLATAVMQE